MTLRPSTGPARGAQDEGAPGARADEAQPTVLPPGSIVHVAHYWRFGRVAAAITGTADGTVYLVDLLGGEGGRQVQALGWALWPCPAAAGKPLCLLSPRPGSA
jgi:hypothetical protein